MMADAKETSSRKNFGKQPAQYLLLDVGYPMTRSTLHSIQLAAQNILALASSMQGRPRIPAFGLAILNSNLNLWYPIGLLKGNFTRITKILNSLTEQSMTSDRVSEEEYKDLLNVSIQSILAEFNAKSQNVCKHSEANLDYIWPNQIQITLVTRKNALPIRDALIDIMQASVSFTLKKFDIIEVVSQYSVVGAEELNRTKFKYVNLIQTSGSCEDLDAIFKNWLLESEADAEHLRLTLRLEPKVTIKCDLSECVLDMSNLYCGQLIKGNDSSNITIGIESNILGGNEVAIHELEMMHRIPLLGLCPSLLHGCPRRLYPTRCWRLSWKESHINQQLFKALCASLSDTENGLLTRLRNPLTPHQTSAFYFIISIFFLFSADGDKLLLHMVAPQELSLPESRDGSLSCAQQAEDEALSIVNHSLRQVPLLEEYSPASFSIGLYEKLKVNLRQPSTKIDFNKLKAQFHTAANEFGDVRSSEKSHKFEPFKVAPKRGSEESFKKTTKRKKKPTSIKSNIHPALLPPKVVAKYRKGSQESYQLAEYRLAFEET